MTCLRPALLFTLATLLASPAGATTVRIHYDTGTQAMQVARDNGGWRAPARARRQGDGVWTYYWPDAAGDINMKPVLNGAPSTGGSYHLARGASVDIYPFFGPATGKVTILEDVASPQLNNSRKLRIYTPPSYDENPAKRYPVIYMHDGQNLFDPKTAAFGTAWEIAATVDRLVGEGRMEEVIVVGIDNTAARMAEYTPCCDPKYGGGSLAAYEAFVVDTVKPLVDQRLRTLPGRAHTAIMGSSLGGIASVLIAAHHPAVFSRAAGLSSSFWWDQQALLRQPPKHLPVRFYIDAGTHDDGLAETAAMRDVMQQQGYVLGRDLLFHADPGGRHNEASWAARVELPLTWFFPWSAGG